MSQQVDLDAGAREFVDPPVLVTADHDITADPFSVGLGTYSAPPVTWLGANDPAVLLTHPTPQQVQVTVLIGDTVKPATGAYWLWVRMTDNPEILLERSPAGRVLVINSGTVTYT